MNLDNFESAGYFHDVSMRAKLEEEIGEMLYRTMDKIDDAAKAAKFDTTCCPSEHCTEKQYTYLKTYLEKLGFDVEFTYRSGDIRPIAGMKISW